ncbi:MAG: hypothetical protein EBR01_11970 [Proteobacteria bacterium]|nr:hypothetical protein [Pseudomonadota bacterium]
MNAREYRQHLYQNRSHPEKLNVASKTSDVSFIYASVAGFLVVEGYLQFKIAQYPSGLLFPMGFLFFWAFFYTYYKPGHLESKLSNESKWDLSGIPDTLMTSCIWFVKIIFVELTEKVISAILNRDKTHPKKRNEGGSRKFSSSQAHSFKNSTYHKSETKLDPILLLPRELSNALHVMGIPGERDWVNIQKRYRELAKKYHPDLNPELTQAGNRFMLYDAAYRKLEAAKDKHFSPKEKSKHR